MTAVEGEAKQVGGAATSIKYFKNTMKELSERQKAWNLNSNCFCGLD